MFGLSLAEILLLAVVAIVVVGPRNVPTLMRQAGRWVAKIRRMSFELRSQSGLDDLIRQEGLEREIAELRSLSRVNVIDTVIAPIVSATAASESTSTRPAAAVGAVPRGRDPEPAPALLAAPPLGGSAYADPDAPAFARELPEIGCDAYGAAPDAADPYEEPASGPVGDDHELPVAGCDAYGAAEDAHAEAAA